MSTGGPTFAQYMASMAVDIPEGECQGMRVRRFLPDPLWNFAYSVTEDRGTRPDVVYTGLFEREIKPDGKRGWKIWMSDTDPERRDHLIPLKYATMLSAKRVLVNGLGIGMLVKGLLALPSVEHIDVVEIDERVITLVGPSYAGPRVTIHHADALAQCRQWPKRTSWDVAWHDIWESGNPAFKSQVSALMRSYGGRVRWQGAWAYSQIMAST